MNRENRFVVEVRPRKKRWLIREYLNTAPEFETREEALDYATKRAIEHHGEIHIFSETGRLIETRSFNR